MKRPKNHHSVITFPRVSLYTRSCDSFVQTFPVQCIKFPSVMRCDSFRSVYPGCFGYNLLLEPDLTARTAVTTWWCCALPPFPAHMLEAWPLEGLLKLTIWLHVGSPLKSVVHMRIGQTLGCGVDGLCCPQFEASDSDYYFVCVLPCCISFTGFFDPVDCLAQSRSSHACWADFRPESCLHLYRLGSFLVNKW